VTDGAIPVQATAEPCTGVNVILVNVYVLLFMPPVYVADVYACPLTGAVCRVNPGGVAIVHVPPNVANN
jgi:hypothetical protein